MANFGVSPDIESPAGDFPVPGTKVRRRILTPDEAASAVRRGIIRAARDYEAWGSEWPSDRGCENLLQVRAAEELHVVMKAQGLGWLTLEQRLADVTVAGTKKRGRPFLNMSNQQRADIAIWTKGLSIYGLIEIKRVQSDGEWEKDLVKLAKLLARYGRLQGRNLRYGVMGAYVSCTEESGLLSRRERILKIAGDAARRYGLSARTQLDESRHHWTGRPDGGWICGAVTVAMLPPQRGRAIRNG